MPLNFHTGIGRYIVTTVNVVSLSNRYRALDSLAVKDVRLLYPCRSLTCCAGKCRYCYTGICR